MPATSIRVGSEQQEKAEAIEILKLTRRMLRRRGGWVKYKSTDHTRYVKRIEVGELVDQYPHCLTGALDLSSDLLMETHKIRFGGSAWWVARQALRNTAPQVKATQRSKNIPILHSVIPFTNDHPSIRKRHIMRWIRRAIKELL